MRLDFGLVLAIFLECVFFIYYAETLFYRKKNKIFCYATAALGYALHGFICMFGYWVINISVFIIVNVAIFNLCYCIKLKNALFQSIILDILSAASEIIVALTPLIGVKVSCLTEIIPMQSLLITLLSNILYLTGIMYLAYFSKSKKSSDVSPSASLLSIPIITLLIISVILNVSDYSNMASIVCFMLMVINLVVLIVNQKLVTQSMENTDLKIQTEKDRIILEQYMILKEKYEQIRIFQHDFKEHMNALSSLIDNDNIKAKEYIKSVYNEESSAQLIEYSDNKMLNVVLSQKKTQCRKNEIQFIIEPISASLAFINDMDTVSIFSNLLNNAIESCASSAKKKIYLNIYTENDNFIVIRLENSSDKEPLVIDGHLKTHKDNDKLHGIGMNSIRKALTNYNATLKWKYDAKEGYFITTIIFNMSFDDNHSGVISTTQEKIFTMQA